MADWMAALDRLQKGMQDPEGQSLRAPRYSDYPSGQETPEAFWARGKQQDAEAVPFGSMADPVSQLAFMLAPQLLPALKGLRASGPMPGGSILGNQRGNLGKPPWSSTGGALPESVARDPETGALLRLYHGTNRTFPDFEIAHARERALYGPGIYLTSSPTVAEGAALREWPDAAQQLHQQILQLSAMQAKAVQVGDSVRAQGLGKRVDGLWQRVRDGLEAQPGSHGGTPQIRPVYADVRKPFRPDTDMIDPRYAPGIRGEHPLTYDEVVAQVGKGKANALLQELGYDSLAHTAGERVGMPHQVYIALSPEQVYPSFAVDALKK